MAGLSPREQKRLERETEAYKGFMKVAKKVVNIEYGKWQISPDPTDPLRKFTLHRDIGWCTLHVRLTMGSHYHRGDYSENRHDYHGLVAFTGLFRDKNSDIVLESNWKVKPRMAKKLLKLINDAVIPGFYKEVEKEKAIWEEKHKVVTAFQAELSKVKGLEVMKGKQTWGDTVYGKLPNCPFELTLEKNRVAIQGSLTYDELAELQRVNKW